MTEIDRERIIEYLPFYVGQAGETDIVFIVVLVSLILIVLGLGALYFTIQSWPDRLAAGASKTQLQIVGILGLISLFTMNNAFFVAGLLFAAIRVPDFLTPLRQIATALKNQPEAIATPLGDTPTPIGNPADQNAAGLDAPGKSTSGADTGALPLGDISTPPLGDTPKGIGGQADTKE